jgi:hypothetical protein
VLLGLLAVTALLGGCGGGGPSSTASADGASSTETSSTSSTPSSSLPAAHSGTPIVYLLGGSSARESIVSDAAWATAVEQAGGPAVRAIDLGSTNETFLDDRRLLRAMDPARPTLLLVGINPSRYMWPVDKGKLDQPVTAEDQAALAGKTDVKHRYSVARIKSAAEKDALVSQWLAERYPQFRQNFKANEEQLGLLLEEAKAKGFEAAILELPMDLEAIGGRYDAPRAQYVDGAKAMARSAGVPYISFLDQLNLPSGDFYDLLHLVEPGREEWQARLSQEVAKLLNESGTGAAN